jgi:L-alanine-DL-glutamate epimerase-like enolase superfamily enzyme
MTRSPEIRISEAPARAYTIPTDEPESDGTLEWESTGLVVVNVRAGEAEGLGWTYGSSAIAAFVESVLAAVVTDRDALDVPGAWAAMVAAVRNDGRPGLCSMAISAVDVALWDLKAKLLELPLVSLLGRVRAEVPVYGSGGFTSYADERLREQLAGWAQEGMTMVKMKIGRDPGRDPHRMRIARAAIGPEGSLFVDANGAYSPHEALAVAEQLTAHQVSWFEEPVSSDDLAGLRHVRDRAPAGIAIAAGEYGYRLVDFERMLAAGAVDVLQADVTRCGGITELLRVDALCAARSRPLSLHCAPALHGVVGAALHSLVHLEYFHDHVRIENMLFRGLPRLGHGALRPDGERPGLGAQFAWSDAECFAV